MTNTGIRFETCVEIDGEPIRVDVQPEANRIAISVGHYHEQHLCLWLNDPAYILEFAGRIAQGGDKLARQLGHQLEESGDADAAEQPARVDEPINQRSADALTLVMNRCAMSRTDALNMLIGWGATAFQAQVIDRDTIYVRRGDDINKIALIDENGDPL